MLTCPAYLARTWKIKIANIGLAAAPGSTQADGRSRQASRESRGLPPGYISERKGSPGPPFLNRATPSGNRITSRKCLEGTPQGPVSADPGMPTSCRRLGKVVRHRPAGPLSRKRCAGYQPGLSGVPFPRRAYEAQANGPNGHRSSQLPANCHSGTACFCRTGWDTVKPAVGLFPGHPAGLLPSGEESSQSSESPALWGSRVNGGAIS